MPTFGSGRIGDRYFGLLDGIRDRLGSIPRRVRWTGWVVFAVLPLVGLAASPAIASISPADFLIAAVSWILTTVWLILFFEVLVSRAWPILRQVEARFAVFRVSLAVIFILAGLTALSEAYGNARPSIFTLGIKIFAARAGAAVPDAAHPVFWSGSLFVLAIGCLTRPLFFLVLSSRFQKDAVLGESVFRARRRDILLFAAPILLTYSIFFISVFPGAIAPDSIVEWRAAHGEARPDDWHTIGHMMTIMLAAKTWDSPAALLVINNLSLALAIGYFCFRCIGWGLPRKRVWIISLFYAVFLPAAAMTQSTLKDTPYAILLMILTILLIEVVMTRGAVLRRPAFLASLAFVGSLTAVFRQYAPVLVLLTFLALLWAYRKTAAREVVLTMAAAGLVFFALTTIAYRSLGILHRPEPALCTPIHHVGAVFHHQGAISRDTLEYFTRFAPSEFWRDRYRFDSIDPYLYDPQYPIALRAASDRAEFLNRWLKLVLRNVPIVLRHQIGLTSNIWGLYPQSSAKLLSSPRISAEEAERWGLTQSFPRWAAAMDSVFRKSILLFSPMFIHSLWILGAMVIWKLRWPRNRPRAFRRGEALLMSLPMSLNIAAVAMLQPATVGRYVYAGYLIAPLVIAAAFLRNIPDRDDRAS
jgi:hypothetical protein